MRVWDGDRTWLALILAHLEEQAVADMWKSKGASGNANLGCFYDQDYEYRTAIINAFYCPSMQHDSRILIQTAATGDGGHGHAATDSRSKGKWFWMARLDFWITAQLPVPHASCKGTTLTVRIRNWRTPVPPPTTSPA